jgi:hypothetical protein
MTTRISSLLNRPPTAKHGAVEVHVREVRQLFDALDPSPFREKDLDPNAEEYIVDSVKELSSAVPCELVIHLDQPTGLSDEDRAIGDALRVHFGRRADLLRRDMRGLFHRGFISLVIGLALLFVCFLSGHYIVRVFGDGGIAPLIRESLVIGGWVAMWRPLEIFLYDWWPILGEKRIRDRLSRVEVRVVHDVPSDRDGLSRILAGTASVGTPPAAVSPTQ